MKFELYKEVALKVDLPKQKLKKGDLVTLVDYLPKNEKRPEHYIAEIFDIKGKTIGICYVTPKEIETFDEKFSYIRSARKLKQTA